LPSRARPAPSVLVLFALALLALFAVAATPASAAPWGAPEEVSVPGGAATSSHVGIDAAGDATAIWTRSDGLNIHAQAALRPVGGGWSAPADLSGANGQAESPTVAVGPAGDVVAAWKERMAGSEAIEVDYKSAGGNWEGAVAVESGPGVVETPAVAIDEVGDAVVIWRGEFAGNHLILASSRPPVGSWSPPVVISSPALNAEAPDVAMGADGTADAVWQSSSGATSVVESSTLPSGGSWSPAIAVSAPATVTEPPHVVATADRFAAIWSRSGVGLVAEVALSPTAGAWSAPESISIPGLEAHATQLAVDSAGDAVAAWYRFDGSVGSVEGTNLTPGGSWTPPMRLSPVGSEAEAPQVAIAPSGVAEVAWSGWNEATHNYETHARRLNAAAAWDDVTTLSLEGEEAYGPHVGLDRAGHAVIVWNGEVGLGAEIISSVRDEASPLVLSKTGNGAGTVTSRPAGIDCGVDCTVGFPEGTTVTLTAAAAAGSRFAGWSGACAGDGECTVAIGESQSSVGAEFVSIPPPVGPGGGGAPGPGVTGPGDGGVGGSGDDRARGSTPGPGGPVCTAAGPVASVGTFLPTPKPGRVVPGIRVTVGVKDPSAVRVTGTLVYGAGRSRRVDLGSLGYHGAGERNLRFVLPVAVRSELPPGATVWVSLAVVTTPDSAQSCATHGAVTHKVKLKIVKVLSTPPSGVS
jgi:Divergent InlB B-repeat domain